MLCPSKAYARHLGPIVDWAWVLTVQLPLGFGAIRSDRECCAD
jgi:hypothetical protein